MTHVFLDPQQPAQRRVRGHSRWWQVMVLRGWMTDSPCAQVSMGGILGQESLQPSTHWPSSKWHMIWRETWWEWQASFPHLIWHKWGWPSSSGSMSLSDFKSHCTRACLLHFFSQRELRSLHYWQISSPLLFSILYFQEKLQTDPPPFSGCFTFWLQHPP